VGQTEPSKRIISLDALRGVAAAVVVLHHCTLVYASSFLKTQGPWRPGDALNLWSWLDFTPLGLMTDGRKMVLLFFVLSGLVLALALKDQAVPRWREFAVKRMARIYVPFAFALGLSIILYDVARPIPIHALSNWFNERTWSQPLTAKLIVGHLLITDNIDWQTLDNVMWSLVQELRISLLFPFMLLALRARPWVSFAAILLFSAVCHSLFDKLPETLPFDPFETGQYLYLFAVGALMALHRERLAAIFAAFPRGRRLLVWVLTVLLVLYPREARLGFFASGLACAALVALCFLDRSAASILSAKIPQWLGKVSYSLYLIHVPLIVFTVHVGYGRLPLPVLLLTGVAAALALAEAMHRWIERPAIGLGKLAVARLKAPAAQMV
jgi:peptidoglycan/LPS O-acetylase OafA/YrhL